MRLLSHEELKKEKGVSYSASQLWRLIKSGKFPRQVKIGDKNFWPEHEIDAFIAERIAARDQSAA